MCERFMIIILTCKFFRFLFLAGPKGQAQGIQLSFPPSDILNLLLDFWVYSQTFGHLYVMSIAVLKIRNLWGPLHPIQRTL